MKYRYSFQYILALAIFFSGCMVEPTFTEPQPPDVSNSKHFKKKFQGSYLSLEDSSVLKIYQNKIVQQWNIKIELNKQEADTSKEYTLSKNVLVLNELKDSIYITITNDTVRGDYNYSQTIFEISEEDVLKYYKKVHFVNYLISPGEWNVKSISINDDDYLSLNKISGKEEVLSMSEYTNVEGITNEKGDTIQYRISPTKKEFKKLLQSDIFKSGSRFKKISQSIIQ